MAAELVCEIHGPYDASHGTCPYCSGTYNRPAGPSPLAEDDLPTDVGGSPMPGGGGGWGEDEATDISPSRQGYAEGFGDEYDPTDIGREARVADVTELEFEDTGSKGILVFKEGPRRGQTRPIGDGTVVARRDGDLVLDDPKVSNPHAKFRIENEKFVLWDFGSKNGTYVNGEKIRAATELKENDEIKIGDSSFVLKVLS